MSKPSSVELRRYAMSMRSCTCSPPLARALAGLGALALMLASASSGAQVQAPSVRTAPVAPAQASPITYPGGKWSPGPARYGHELVEDIKVTMDDGVVLDASIAWPTDLATGRRASGTFPVVVEHMPYVQFAVPVTANPFFAERGYIAALVRARGLGKSGGEVQFLSPREGLDGKAIVDWAAHGIEGSDGRVGLIGCSWPGAIAMGDAAAVGPGSPLKAVVAACSGMGNMNRQSWLNAGLPTMSFWQFEGLGPMLTGNSDAGRRFFRQFSQSVLAGDDMAYHAEYWGQRGQTRLARQIVDNNVPMLLWGGWGDVLDTGTLRAYAALQNAHAGRPLDAPMVPDQRTSPRWQLIMGGWDHGQGLDMGLYLQWLDTWIKGIDTGIQNTSTPMHVFEQGTERWLNLSGFPVVEPRAHWALGADGSLGSADMPARAAQNTLRFDDPSTKGATLSYTSAPLADGATISGPMSVTLYASSSNTNLVFLGRLYDVAPDGRAVLISRGALLGSQHTLDPDKSWPDARGNPTWPWPTLAKDEYLVPGQVYRFELPLNPRQWGLRPGHRVRLELSTQTPADRCPPTGLPSTNDSDPCRLTRPQEKTVPGGIYTTALGGATPSTLNLPLLPYKAFPEARAGLLPMPWNEGRRSVDVEGTPRFTLPLDWSNP